MISALLVALREGVEAALVVGIVLVYLDRSGRGALKRYAWAGVFLAVLASIGAAIGLQQLRISEDGFEGVLMLVAAALVVSVIVWMNRVAHGLRKHIENRVASYAEKTTAAAGWGIGAFVFFMVVREGAELVLILRAVELSTEGLQVWIGTILGIALAVGVGYFFFQGTLRIPLHRFFRATSLILMVVAFQLALTGMHELSEAQWIWSSKTEMATIGPIVRNEVFFFAVILGVAALVVLREWFAARRPVDDPGLNAAERRKLEWEFKKQRRWSFAAATLCAVVIISLAADFAYTRVTNAQSPATILRAQDGEVLVPLSQLHDAKMHFYTADANDIAVRFFIIHYGAEYVVALDACEICGWAGYRQDGQNVVCRNCGSAIYIPSIGEKGGCNPIPVRSGIQGNNVVIDISALESAAAKVHS